jgi:hypothetical protein
MVRVSKSVSVDVVDTVVVPGSDVKNEVCVIVASTSDVVTVAVAVAVTVVERWRKAEQNSCASCL